MKQPPVISVVVCTYNQQDTIGRTLDSILMQQCHVPFEIVIGEDYSTDDTLALCQQYADKHPDIIRLIANTHNKGLVDNYFDCLLACRGKYIADCAGDDFWIDSLKLEKECKVMEDNPNVTMVITNWQFFHEDTGMVSPSRQQHHAPVTSGHKLLKAIITQKYMSVFHLCTSLYRADVFRHAYEEDISLFRDKDNVSEDMQIAFVMAQHGDIAYLPDVTLNYSCGGNGISNTRDDAKLFVFLKKTTRQIIYLARKEQLDIQNFLSERIFVLGMHAFRIHNVQFFHEILQFEKNWNTERLWRTKVLFIVMRHEWLWTLGLQARKAFVTLKRLFR